MAEIHPFYEAHRGAMEAAMRQRLDLVETMLRDRAQLADLNGVNQGLLPLTDVSPLAHAD